MSSRKTELKRHVEYLYARRSGAEYCLGLVEGILEQSRIKAFIRSLSASIQENGVELATIEQAEAKLKEAEKQRKAELHEEMKVR